ncbi:MAG: CPBP family intramembrane metalloprotease [Chloroflexi bacterium]|nr:CPBP family intramembrane metalloprotease [Chloroflexota bacterium]
MPSQSFFQKYELALFFLLSYLLSWWSAPFANGGIIPHGPAIAAVIVIALTTGRQGLREYWRRLTNFRAGWWYLVGPAIIAAYLLAAFAANLLLGATAASPFPSPSLGTLIILLLMGGLWEEPGWTGYALPKLQERFAPRAYGTFAATLVMGFVRSLWHLPLVLYGGIAWYDAAFFSFAFQIIITWLYNRSNGSVPAVMVFHYASNVLAGSVMLSAFSGAEKAMYYVLFVVFACLIALIIARQTNMRLGFQARK